MITISTYTEPAQAAVVESPRPWEPEKEEGPEMFADILAGLLKKTGNDGGIEAPLADFDEGPQSGFESTSGDEAAAAEKKNHLLGTAARDDGETGKIAVKTDKNSAKNENPEINLSEEENQNVLLAAELLLNPYIDQAVHTGEGAALEDFPEEQGVDLLAGLEQAELAGQADTDFDVLQTPNAAFWEALEETAALAEAPKKSIQEETPVKREFPNSENSEALAAAERQRSEGLALQAKSGSEKESRTRLEETRGRDRRRDRLSVDVRDFRTETESQGAQKSAQTRFNAGAEIRSRGENATREITLELRLPDQGQNPAAAETHWEVKAGAALENLLARELHQNFNGDIVRHASMALRDGGEGTIRLALKPESLGNVKIRLEMAENKITGHIVVESEEALRAFQKEIPSLEQAFRESGFQNANLNLSLAADGRGTDQFRQETDAGPFLPQTAALRYDEALEQAGTPFADASAFYVRGRSSINMLV